MRLKSLNFKKKKAERHTCHVTLISLDTGYAASAAAEVGE